MVHVISVIISLIFVAIGIMIIFKIVAEIKRIKHSQMTEEQSLAIKKENIEEFSQALTDITSGSFFIQRDVKISDCINIKSQDPKQNKAVERFCSNTIDFILYSNLTMKPEIIVEFVGPSYDSKKAEDSIRFKTQFFKKAGLKFLSFNAADKIDFQKIQEAIGKPANQPA